MIQNGDVKPAIWCVLIELTLIPSPLVVFNAEAESVVSSSLATE